MAMISRKDLEVSIAETKELQKTMIQKKYTERDEKTYDDVIERIISRLETYRGCPAAHPYSCDASGMKRYLYSAETFEDMKSLLRDRYFIPAGSILSGVTTTDKKSSLSNCYVLDIKQDSIEGIFDCIKEAARTYSYRGGVGVDISILRPNGAIVNNAAKTSTGAVSFMPVISQTNAVIGTEGRRAAMMLSIANWHPDFFRFVWCKAMPEAVFMSDNMSYDRTAKDLQKLDLSNVDPNLTSVLSTLAWTGKTPDVDTANISVTFTDKFMEAVRSKTDEPVVFQFPDIQADKALYNECWKGDLDEWIRIGGKVNDYTTSTLICTRKTLPIFDNKTIDHVLVNGQTLTKEDSSISTVDWLSELLDRFNAPIRVTFKNPSAYECFRDLAKAAWIRADPGVMFLDRHQTWCIATHIDPDKLKARTSNPCGEQNLAPGQSCLLGAHVLPKYVLDPWTKNARFDYQKFTENCITATILMNFFSDYNESLHPLKIQTEMEVYAKRIGIEFTGLADMLSMLNVTYDSYEALQIVDDIMHLKGILEIATSARLAMNYGPCPACNPRKNPKGLQRLISSPYFEHLLDVSTLSPKAQDMLDSLIARSIGVYKTNTKEILEANIKACGLRNTSFNTVGPTGTISILANNCSSGIEPVFALFMKRNTRVGDKGSYNICHTPVAEHLLSYMKEHNLDEIDSNEVKKMYSVKEAYEIDYHSRIAMQKTVQNYCDSSISSTVNLPNSSTPKAILEIYLEAWENGLKGITIFRDGSLNAVLEVMKSDTPKKEEKHDDTTLNPNTWLASSESSDTQSPVRIEEYFIKDVASHLDKHLVTEARAIFVEQGDLEAIKTSIIRASTDKINAISQATVLLYDAFLMYFLEKHIDELEIPSLVRADTFFVCLGLQDKKQGHPARGALLKLSKEGKVSFVYGPIDLPDIKTSSSSDTSKTLARGEIAEMPTVAHSHRHEVHWEGHKFYIVITVDESGAPMEVFTSNLPTDISVKDGVFNESDYQFKQSLWIGICRLISISLRGGIPVAAIIKQLNKAKNTVTDIMAIIARVLGQYTTSHQVPTFEGPSSTSGYNLQVCPSCGKKTLRVEAGCNTCLNCMYSRCE